MTPEVIQASERMIQSATIPTDVFVVSEDEPGQWRVADRGNDSVYGPFGDETAALCVAREAVRCSRRWEIHVLDQFGTLINTYNSDDGALHASVEKDEEAAPPV